MFLVRIALPKRDDRGMLTLLDASAQVLALVESQPKPRGKAIGSKQDAIQAGIFTLAFPLGFG